MKKIDIIIKLLSICDIFKEAAETCSYEEEILYYESLRNLIIKNFNINENDIKNEINEEKIDYSDKSFKSEEEYQKFLKERNEEHEKKLNNAFYKELNIPINKYSLEFILENIPNAKEIYESFRNNFNESIEEI